MIGTRSNVILVQERHITITSRCFRTSLPSLLHYKHEVETGVSAINACPWFPQWTLCMAHRKSHRFV